MARRHLHKDQLLLVAVTTSWCAGVLAVEPQPFEIGAMLAPPALPIDYNTANAWQRLRDCGIDTIFGTEDGSGYTKAVNETAIANAHRSQVRLFVVDPAVYGHATLDTATYHYWESVLPAYASDRRVQGFTLRDEPSYVEFEALANSYRRIKQFNRRWHVFVNLAYAGGPFATDDPTPLAVSNVYSAEWGQYLEPGSRLGQTFSVPKRVVVLRDIELQLDPVQWPSGEALTLTLWDGPGRAISYGQAQVKECATNVLRFTFAGGVAVPAGTTAYFELTHAGRQLNAIGRVMRSVSNTYPEGAAFQDGVAQPYDLQFRVHAQRFNTGDGYENVIDDWINLSGADYIHSTTVYPWRGTWDAGDYFVALERLRGRALAHALPFGLFLQSVKIVDVRNGASTYRDPTPAMMRWNAYTALSYGAKRFYWFIYWPPANVNVYSERFFETPVTGEGSPTGKYYSLRGINQELHALGRVMGGLTSRRVFHTGTSLPDGVRALPTPFFVRPTDPSLGLVIGYFTNSGGRSFLMVVNRSYKEDLPNVELAFETAPSNVTEISKISGMENAAAGYRAGMLHLTRLAAGEGRLFALNPTERPYLNLAAFATVQATSSWESTQDGYGLDKVHDDLRASIPRNLGWSSQGELLSDHLEAVTFDLEASRKVAAVDVYPLQEGQMFPTRLVIETSIDGRTWSRAAESRSVSPPRGVVAHVFEARIARYVRINGTELRAVNGQFRMQLGEVEIYSRPNLAIGATVTATSSIESPPQRSLALVHDRQHGVGSGWSSSGELTSNHVEALTFELGSHQALHGVRLYPWRSPNNQVEGFPLDVWIETSADGRRWNKAASRTSQHPPDHRAVVLGLPPTVARYVRVVGSSLRSTPSQGVKPYRMQLAEVEIF